MKKLYIGIWLIGLTYTATVSHAQAKAIPAEVTNAFNKMFPNATNVQWKEKVSYYVAFFNVKNEKYEAKFAMDAGWLSTERGIPLDSLPSLVKDSLKLSTYAGWTQSSSYKIQTPSGKEQYHVVLTKAGEGRKIVFLDQNGHILDDH